MKNKKLLFSALASLILATGAMAQVPNYVPVDGLVAYYSFNGNANDVSSNANNGTVNGATLTADRFGNTNSAYNFNGTSNYIEVKNNLLTSQTSYTINLWTKIESNQAIDLFNDRTEPSCFYKYRILVLDGKIQFWKYTSSSIEKVIGNTVPLNQWVMFTAVFDNSQKLIKLYTNSILNSSLASLNWNLSQNATTIGGLRGCNTNGTFNIQNGPIDDIGIWNRTLTENEINNLYNANICYANITVTDTLIINIGLLSVNPVTYKNTITISPNPAKDHVVIDCGNIANITGYQIKINNSLGQEVFATVTNQQQFTVPLQNWGGTGLYFVSIIDAQGHTVDVKKIILE